MKQAPFELRTLQVPKEIQLFVTKNSIKAFIKPSIFTLHRLSSKHRKEGGGVMAKCTKQKNTNFKKGWNDHFLDTLVRIIMTEKKTLLYKHSVHNWRKQNLHHPEKEKQKGYRHHRAPFCSLINPLFFFLFFSASLPPASLFSWFFFPFRSHSLFVLVGASSLCFLYTEVFLYKTRKLLSF